jgi:tripeptide aminopeptidase
MDTVGTDTNIKPQIRDGVIYSDGTTILGGDDKSGVAVIRKWWKSREGDLPHPRWRLS